MNLIKTKSIIAYFYVRIDEMSKPLDNAYFLNFIISLIQTAKMTKFWLCLKLKYPSHELIF
jgi:hypothetical protein